MKQEKFTRQLLLGFWFLLTITQWGGGGVNTCCGASRGSCLSPCTPLIFWHPPHTTGSVDEKPRYSGAIL